MQNKSLSTDLNLALCSCLRWLMYLFRFKGSASLLMFECTKGDPASEVWQLFGLLSKLDGYQRFCWTRKYRYFVILTKTHCYSAGIQHQSTPYFDYAESYHVPAFKTDQWQKSGWSCWNWGHVWKVNDWNRRNPTVKCFTAKQHAANTSTAEPARAALNKLGLQLVIIFLFMNNSQIIVLVSRLVLQNVRQ